MTALARIGGDTNDAAAAESTPLDGPGPYSIEAEQMVLGAILLAHETWDSVSGILRPEDFFDPLHGRIFSYMAEIRRSGHQIGVQTLQPYLMDEPELVPGMSASDYVVDLLHSAVSLMNLPAQARYLRDLAARRRLVAIGRSLVLDASRFGGAPREEITAAIREMDDILAETRERRASQASLAGAVQSALERLDDPEVPGFFTGLRDLDNATGGWHRGEYVLLAGRPSMGKSAVATSLGLRTAMAGHGVAYFSLEMTKESLANRCLSDLAWEPSSPIPYHEIAKKTLSDADKRRLYAAARRFNGLPFMIDDQAGLTVSEITARARRMQALFEEQGKQLDLIVVDHLGKVRPSGRYAGQKVQETGEISGALAELAKELDVCVLALSQLSRSLESRDDKRPTLADLRNSGDLEQDADTVLFVYRQAYYLERTSHDDDEKELARQTALANTQHKIEIIIAKQRSGPCLTIQAYADMACNVIRDGVRS